MPFALRFKTHVDCSALKTFEKFNHSRLARREGAREIHAFCVIITRNGKWGASHRWGIRRLA